ncbi:MAG TPA: glycosyltransferase family 2 protein, partial [Candidatus Tectomicrobia bacterium]|nr:glycosyltransferase family 2 protein [Candidatus Tectomicrobia bacterium]
MDLSVVIPTHDRPDLLRRTLGSLRAAKPCGLAWEVLVVLNSTPPRLRRAYEDVLREGPAGVRGVDEPVQGKCRALNTGIRAARGHAVAFLDDDVIAHDGYLVGIEEALREDGYRIFGGRVLPVWTAPPPRWAIGDAPLTTSRGPIVAHDHGDTPRPYVPGMYRPVGCNFFCHRALFDQHGYFDLRLGPGSGKGHMGGEESQLLRRFQERGERILYVPRVAVDHPVDPARVTKRYFRYRMFCSGRSAPYLTTRTYVTLFDVPRHLYVKALTALGRSLAATLRGRSVEAFERQLDLCRYVGAAYEY